MTPEHKIYSDSTISRFLTEISADDRVNFLNNWNEHRNHDERIYISYDSTNKNCKAGDIEKAEYGHPKNDVGSPIFNYSVAYDINNQIPLLYESYPGSIVDVSQLHYVIEKFQGYGYKNIGFVLDRGYFSKDNIKYMESCNYDYVIMVKGKASFVHQRITDHKGEFELKDPALSKNILPMAQPFKQNFMQTMTMIAIFICIINQVRKMQNLPS